MRLPVLAVALTSGVAAAQSPAFASAPGAEPPFDGVSFFATDNSTMAFQSISWAPGEAAVDETISFGPGGASGEARVSMAPDHILFRANGSGVEYGGTMVLSVDRPAIVRFAFEGIGPGQGDRLAITIDDTVVYSRWPDESGPSAILSGGTGLDPAVQFLEVELAVEPGQVIGYFIDPRMNPGPNERYAFTIRPIPGCAVADLSPPFGVINQTCVAEFVNGYFSGSLVVASMAAPIEIVTQADVSAFVTKFFEGCPF
ncbi:MAG: hypothetical protein AAFR38_09790 [Planctomycetota bacterium]